ncbi:MAG: ABC transporter permease [Bryobacteraceae bacterium]
MMRTLLWKNLLFDKLRFFIAVAGISFSAFLITVQADLLFSFTRSASRIIDAADASIWIMPKGVPCFDYAAPMPRGVKELAFGVPGVHSVGLVAAGFASLQKPDGQRQAVLIVGVEREFAGRIPSPSKLETGQGYFRNATVDISDVDLFGESKLPYDVEVASKGARITAVTTGFSSFLGTPFVFAEYRDALDLLAVPAEKTMFIVVKLTPGTAIEDARSNLHARLPEYDIWSTEEFSQRARSFWLLQTGAGGALLLAATLGFMVGLAIVTQTMYASTMEHIEEFATLKALGATRGYVFRLVAGQSFLCGLVGTTIGFLAVPPTVTAARSVITWIEAPVMTYGIVGAILILLCLLAAILAVQPAMRIEPGRVFRA